MRRTLLLSIGLFICACGSAWADTFGTGDNQFTIDFVDITGDASAINGLFIGSFKPEGFTDPGYDYRMGVYEVTNAQWECFSGEYGVLTGDPFSAYNESSMWKGSNIPANKVSWYEAAQFVNWLNTSNGYQAAYKFTGTKGTSDYRQALWDASDAWGGTNRFRHKNAHYFLPTEEEWVKAAYWNGLKLQVYSNASTDDLVSGEPDPARWNYLASEIQQPWNVGSGAKELNGTYDMMGNVWEWLENPWESGDYTVDAARGLRGASYYNGGASMLNYQSRLGHGNPSDELMLIGFRVASVPEPTSLVLLGVCGLALRRRRRW